MRIIGGTGKGRRLVSPKGRETRPTQDKVREAIFNILESSGPYQRVLDLFAGSGAMGLEALSRWGGQATFVECSREALKSLSGNIRRLQMDEKARLVQGDLRRGINFLKKIGEAYDLVFMDPPYGQGWAQTIIPQFLDSGLVEESGTVVLEHEAKEFLPLEIGEWGIRDQRRYGQTRVSFYTFLKG
jgi:16S rRNA (guanine966-N2)-methyltransferase